MAELVDASVLGTDRAICEGSSPFRPTKQNMKVTVENKKGLNKDLKILIDKETMSSYTVSYTHLTLPTKRIV